MPWPPGGVKNFKPSEFDSRDLPGSGEKYMEAEMVLLCQAIRDEVGFAIHINSAFRTRKRQRQIRRSRQYKSVRASAHLKGMAVDIRIESSWHRHMLLKAMYKLGVRRIGIADRFIHIDIDPLKPQECTWYYNVPRKLRARGN